MRYTTPRLPPHLVFQACTSLDQCLHSRRMAAGRRQVQRLAPAGFELGIEQQRGAGAGDPQQHPHSGGVAALSSQMEGRGAQVILFPEGQGA